MSTSLSSRRNFGTWMVSLFAGAGVGSALSASQTPTGEPSLWLTILFIKLRLEKIWKFWTA